MRLLPPLLLLLLVLEHVQPATAQPRLLGCRDVAVDELLPRAAFSAFGDSDNCAARCGQQAALLAAVSASWCFCLNQPAAAANLTSRCDGPAPSGREMLRFFSLPGPDVGVAMPPTDVIVGSVRLTFVRCAAGPVSTQPAMLDQCVHNCASSHLSFIALGLLSSGSDTFYNCSCGSEDGFGATLPAARCSARCWRGQEEMDMTCGGPGEAFSVYQTQQDGPASTPAARVTTQRSTLGQHCGTPDRCSGLGTLINDSCYVSIPLSSIPGTNHDSYPDAKSKCQARGTDWRVWAVDTEAELAAIYNNFLPNCAQDALTVVTSGLAQADGSVRWDGWDSAEPAGDWLVKQVTGTSSAGNVIIIEDILKPYGSETLKYSPPNALPELAVFVVCEAGLLQTTTDSTPTSSQATTSRPTSTALSTTTAPSTPTASTLTTASGQTTSPTMPTTSPTAPPTTPDSTTPSAQSTMPSSSSPTPPPSTTTATPDTPDNTINDLIDKLNGTAGEDISGQDVIDTVDQLGSLLEQQRNVTQGMDQGDRLVSNTKFTEDMVRLVDLTLGATNAWLSNMTETQRQDASKKLMSSTENTGFLLANSMAKTGSDDVIEMTQPSLVMSASSVSRRHDGSFRFPRSADVQSWIELPAGYALLAPGAGDRLPQVGLLYRSAVLPFMLSPADNSLDDSEKRLNSPVLGFSLGSAGRQVRFSEVAGARLRLQYRRAARQPAGRPVWRTLYPGERPAAVPGTAVCAYWSEHDLEWRTDGCQLMGSSSSDHATCSCSHLTNFAILMDYHEYVGTPLSLSVLTWLLGTLSVICLILTWVVFTFTSPPPDVPTAVRSLRCCRTTITRHLCATYAAGLVLLLTVMDRHLVYLEPIACSLAGMAIHYCFLSVFAWSMVEGVHLYKVLRHVFEPKSNSMTRYYMYGYLGPALIVIVTNTVALGTDQYAYVRDEFCWLKVPYFIWFFNGPLAVVLIMNMLVVVLAFRSAASLKVNQLRAKKERIKR
ncbi:adhesion G protein-coupled receptor L3-like [Pollicipes pollicipes]|uniref:adhesion G protein-coupled receptor L3-like n=1 Tax=Pollicipes pollicipes TaxID=41117 RepID=UPI001884E547|nr:adhesion G protein-coupled receptor L3-like [Pollicipes pollicipes]